MGYPSMERAGSISDSRVPPPATDRPTRQIEGLISSARQISEQSQFLASRLHDVRRRLTGEGDPQQAESAKVKEVPPSELVELYQALGRIHENLNDIGRYTETLERI